MSHTLLHGDCLELMKTLPSKSIDFILADLPYGTTHAKWDSTIPLQSLWKEYKRIIKDHGCIALFSAEPFASKLRMSNQDMYKYDWVWKKTLPTLFLQAHHRPLKIDEYINIFYKHRPTYNPQMRTGFKSYKSYANSKKRYQTIYGTYLKEIPNNNNNNGTRYPINIINFSNSNHNRLHPTQKPVNLLRYLIKTYTNKHDLILDNTMGSGSTGVAATQLDRDFIGMEKDDHYFKIASDRISKVNPNQPVTN